MNEYITLFMSKKIVQIRFLEIKLYHYFYRQIRKMIIMKYNVLLSSLLFLALIMTSCGDKAPELKEEAKPELKQDVLPLDTIQEETVIDDVTEPVQQGPRIFVVQKGAWIYDIARKEYNDIHAWRKIYEANKDKIVDPDLIYPGQELVLPE